MQIGELAPTVVDGFSKNLVPNCHTICANKVRIGIVGRSKRYISKNVSDKEIGVASKPS